MNLNTIFFIGPQGSGKGTQAKLLAAKLGFFYWEMGGILREVAGTDTTLGKEVKQLIENGVLLPDEKLWEVVKMRLEKIPANTGVIFDGIPRRINQAEWLMEYLKAQGRKDYATLFIDVPKTESVNRILLRAKKEGRADDTQELVEKRLQQYYDATLPVVEYLKSNTIFFEIDGRPPVEEVTSEIYKNLKLKI